MKMQITTGDVPSLTGKFIIQINCDNENVVLSDKNWGFYQEKRISFVCGLKLIGFYHEHQCFDNSEDFVTYFNHYLHPNTMEVDVAARKNSRFHRLLTSKEIDFVCNKMKQNQY